jgi:hypothetical protein
VTLDLFLSPGHAAAGHLRVAESRGPRGWAERGLGGGRGQEREVAAVAAKDELGERVAAGLGHGLEERLAAELAGVPRGCGVEPLEDLEHLGIAKVSAPDERLLRAALLEALLDCRNRGVEPGARSPSRDLAALEETAQDGERAVADPERGVEADEDLGERQDHLPVDRLLGVRKDLNGAEDLVVEVREPAGGRRERCLAGLSARQSSRRQRLETLPGSAAGA